VRAPRSSVSCQAQVIAAEAGLSASLPRRPNHLSPRHRALYYPSATTPSSGCWPAILGTPSEPSRKPGRSWESLGHNTVVWRVAGEPSCRTLVTHALRVGAAGVPGGALPQTPVQKSAFKLPRRRESSRATIVWISSGKRCGAKTSCQGIGDPRQILVAVRRCIDFNLLLHQADNPEFRHTYRG
jgi:hypothetical protein